MAITNYYVRATNGADVAGQGTTHATAYKTIQFALDDIGTTHGRNAVDGDQINICDSSLEGANVLAASLTLATYGTPTAAAPLILRGYTAVANDGGHGAITLTNNVSVWASAYNYISMIHVDVTGTTSIVAYIVNLGDYCWLRECIFTAGGYSSGPNLLSGVLSGCYFTGFANQSLRLARGLVHGNYISATSGTLPAIAAVGIVVATGNIVYLNTTGAKVGIDVGNQISSAIGNIVYNAAAGTGIGIRVGDSSGLQLGMAMNNIVCGFSGVGGRGISSGALNAQATGYNAFWNNAIDESYGHSLIDDLANDVALAADPFTDAANGDFSLTEAAKTALAAAGWPQSYLGAHANTVPNLNIGPIQMAASSGGGGGPVIGSRVIRGLGAL